MDHATIWVCIAYNLGNTKSVAGSVRLAIIIESSLHNVSWPNLASSPGLLFSLNVTKEMNGRTDECVRKIGLVHTAEVVVRMH